MKNIPVLAVEGRSLAEAYERALVSLFAHGVRLPTQYDKPGDPLRIDATMDITVLEPEVEISLPEPNAVIQRSPDEGGGEPGRHRAGPGRARDKLHRSKLKQLRRDPDIWHRYVGV